MPSSPLEHCDDDWFEIVDVAAMPPFMVTVVSDDAHWMFATSNGGLTMGRGTPERALFPYTTQDKLVDLARSTGSLSLLRWRDAGGTLQQWRPFDPDLRPPSRRMARRLDGTGLRFSERSPDGGLELTIEWGFSRRFGFVRRATLRHAGDAPLRVDVLDGLQNVSAVGLPDDFVARFGNLVDAYKRVECLADTGLRLVYLSSVPTDRAEPSECLRANVVWGHGLPAPTRLVRLAQLPGFVQGAPLAPEAEARGERAACLELATLALAPGDTHRWTVVADVDLSTAAASRLQRFLQTHDAAARDRLLDAELAATRAGLRRLVASADGLQCTADPRRQHRHYSNVMYNIMRGGIVHAEGRVPRSAVVAHVTRFDRSCAARHADWLASLPETVVLPDLTAQAAERGDPTLERLVRELLPLTFSRRHGDPSRPWNRFAIEVRDRHGEPRLSWQGNWRDIFQNWEALALSFPAFLEGMVSRFVSASTVDGYNPYRITHEGIDWEVPDPDEPWSNIGYWGDHQLVYLLRLLEASRRTAPEALDALLERRVFTYADVPYRIATYAETVADPRSTIRFDTAAAAAIDERVAARGADGKLLPGPDDAPLHAGLLEKLLVPLLAKLSNFVPGGGIWMNTQRPEWNDANNALVGFGVSVVTLAYAHRTLQFLLDWLSPRAFDETVLVGREVVALLRRQAAVFERTGLLEAAVGDAALRRTVMDHLGEDASEWREARYAHGLSGETLALPFGELRAFLADARQAVAASLRANRRPDGLFHSYNLLRFGAGGTVHLSRLPEMLEGQVAILSAGLLDPAQALAVATALRQSALYRADKDSYLLYPDKDLPRFLEKNRLGEVPAAAAPLVAALAAERDQDIVEPDADGALRFAGHLRNAAELADALAALPSAFSPLVEAGGEALTAHFEALFDHHAFTGRSGTFFAYEGLGSIYWHMVSKLVVALQEQALAAPEGSAVARGLAAAWRDALEGLGMHASAREYGAFPTDAYSHTPKHAGAQQPGMTGQVKEDILSRWGELGVTVADGRVAFRPRLLQPEELLDAPATFRFQALDGSEQALVVPAGGLAFTCCGVPVVYRAGAVARLRVVRGTEEEEVAGDVLAPQDSADMLHRRGGLSRVEVEFPRDALLTTEGPPGRP